ncbi:MAG: hypothetical protein HN377_13615, partial [Alphaproteobacteria bacterium]|nr:hypothetical protein [Alphaproteobacteria bacterium]
ASPTPVPVAEAPTIEAPLKTFGTISLNLAEGCAITDVRPDGVRAYLTIGGGATCSRIIVIDTVRGRILGTIKP